jgi:SAM-dependent methyltransferase
MAWKSSSKKHKPSPAEQVALRRLDSVRAQRRPFEHLSRTITHTTLERALPEDGPVIEIGSGDGQLTARLPPALLPRVVHTEPFAAARREFRKRWPEREVVAAPAEKLPFDDGYAAAIIALCVLDVVEDGPAVVRELSRVLRPGGRFIHWLDMSTRLDEIIAALAATGMVPLPNVFSDPSAAQWPEDLFLAPRHELQTIHSILDAQRHALARPLAQYLSIFGRNPFPLATAVAEFVRIQEDATIRSALRSMFRAAFDLASPEQRAALAKFQGRQFSSALHFENRLRRWFTPEDGFQVQLSGVMAASELVPGTDSSVHYMSSCVGEQRHLPTVPDVFLCSDATVGTGTETLVELGVAVFVASRI